MSRGFIKNKKGYSRFFIKDKKGGEKVLSIYLFLIYIIVVIGIVSGVWIVYGSGLDVRQVEAEVLVDKTIDCLVDNGVLNVDVKNLNLDKCGFDFKDNTQKYLGKEEIGVRVKIFDFSNCKKIKENLNCGNALNDKSFGNKEYLKYCDMKKENKFPQCVKKEIYVLDNKGKGVLLGVEGVVGKYELNR